VPPVLLLPLVVHFNPCGIRMAILATRPTFAIAEINAKFAKGHSQQKRIVVNVTKIGFSQLQHFQLFCPANVTAATKLHL
jgi:hypothetical protein